MIRALAFLAVPLGPMLFITLVYLLVHATPNGRRQLGRSTLAVIGVIFILALLGACDRTTEAPTPRPHTLEDHPPTRTTSDWLKQ